MIDTTNALVPTSEAAAPSSHRTRPADPSSAVIRFWTLKNGHVHTLRGSVAAAAGLLSALLDRFAAFCRELSGEIEFSESVRRRGYLGPRATCERCMEDVHDAGEVCPRAKAADCSACGCRVVLTAYFHCPAAHGASEIQTTHRPCNVATATQAEWTEHLTRLRTERRRATALRRCTRTA